MMFPTVLPLPSTSISFAAGVECFLAQTGSASMASGLSVGAFPSKVTVPVMVEAATATPGQNDTTINPAASHNLFPVARIIGSSVIAKNSFPSSPSTLLSPKSAVGRLYTGPAVCATWPASARANCSGARTRQARSKAQTFSNASDSASLGSRSGTSA